MVERVWVEIISLNKHNDLHGSIYSEKIVIIISTVTICVITA